MGAARLSCSQQAAPPPVWRAQTRLSAGRLNSPAWWVPLCIVEHCSASREVRPLLRAFLTTDCSAGGLGGSLCCLGGRWWRWRSPVALLVTLPGVGRACPKQPGCPSLQKVLGRETQEGSPGRFPCSSSPGVGEEKGLRRRAVAALEPCLGSRKLGSAAPTAGGLCPSCACSTLLGGVGSFASPARCLKSSEENRAGRAPCAWLSRVPSIGGWAASSHTHTHTLRKRVACASCCPRPELG